MSDESHFIAAMAADPDDDTPRLVFADWLQEHGQHDRAEFIRLQCRPDRDDPAVWRREEELLKSHQAEWEGPFIAIGAEAKFHRGFPYTLEVDFARLVENLSLLALAPEWDLVLLRDESDDPQLEYCVRLATAPYANRLRGLNVAWGWWQPAELGAILTPAVVKNLRELRFSDYYKPEILDLVLDLPGLRLDVLAFYGDSAEGVGDEGCRLIANAPQFASLRELELPNNEIGPDGVAALANSPHIRELRDLDLAGGSNSPNMIGPEGARHIAASENFSHLESLDLVFNRIGDAGFAALAESPRLPALRSLNIPGNDITDKGVQAFARSAGMPALNWLNLCGMLTRGITADAIQELVNSPRMARLTGLKLAGHRIGNEGAFALADSPASSNLRELHVSACAIGVAGFVRMLESPHLAGVSEFSLSENGLFPEEIQSLKEHYGDRVK